MAEGIALTACLLVFGSRCHAQVNAMEGTSQVGQTRGTSIVPVAHPRVYADGRPAARFRLDAKDHGVVLRHGERPDGCDVYGARDVWVWEHRDTLYMHYDGAGRKGWLSCLAVSTDALHWTTKGPVLELGPKGERDAASASYGLVFQEGDSWHMFYLGTPNTSPAPELIPAFPYLTMKAEGPGPAGPWTKRYDVEPFAPRPGTYYSVTASPGYILRKRGEYRMFFSASTDRPILRTIGIARTRDLNGRWQVDEQPIVPPGEQVENSSMYYQETSGTWFLFTNHVGVRDGLEYTDAIWVYWTNDPERWDPANKAIVLDRENCRWSKEIIGLPSVVRIGERLALFYDGHAGEGIPPGAASHMQRDVGLAWLDLPLIVATRRTTSSPSRSH